MELTKSQKQIININDKTMLVSASAGSGKTFVITEKIIKEIVEDKIDIDSLLILTFTNAAASELKERIKKGLYKCLEQAKKNKELELVKYIHMQISKLPNSNISTIHSFCLRVIRENFEYLGIDPLVTTLDESKANIMVTEILTEILDSLYELEDENKRNIFFDILEIYKDEENLKNNILTVYYKYKNILNRDKFFDNIDDLYSNLKETEDLINTEFGKDIISSIKQKASLLVYEIQNVINELPDEKEYLNRKEILEYIIFNLNKIKKVTKFDELYNIISDLINIKSLPSRPQIDENLKELISVTKKKSKDFAIYLSKIIYKLSKDCITDLKSTYPYIKFISEVIISMDNIYETKKKEIAQIEFSDYEHLAYKALSDENIKNRYMDKFKKIYIDEYQDTSMLQEQIIQKIAKDNNLVMVGDVKQSIYGFRNASPKLFMNKYEEYKDIDEIDKADVKNKKCKVLLSTNFRSRKEVIDSVNDIFSKLMELEFGGTNYCDKEKLVYGDIYTDNINANYKTEIYIIEKQEDQSKSDLNEAEILDEDIEEPNEIEEIKGLEKEAICAANKIKDLINNKFPIYDTKKEKYKPIEYKDIVVLMKSAQNKANIVESVFKKFNIPVYADTKEGFFKSDEILLVYSFLKVLDNPLDDISIVSIMFSLIGKFNLDDIYKIKDTSKEKKYMYNILKESVNLINDIVLKQKINDFLNLLERFNIYKNTYSVGKLIALLYEETKLYDLIGLEEENKILKMNLDSFLNIAYDFESKEHKGLNEFLKYIARISKITKGTESPKIIGENENVVRIMTIHKSKGLEFPVVILLNSASKYNLNENSELLQIDEKYGLGFNVLEKDLKVTYPSIITKSIKQKNEEESIKEEIRLLYVALTRAKEKLIIFGTVNNYKKYIKDIYDFRNYDKIPYSIKINIKNHLKCILYSILNSDMKNFDIILQNNSNINEVISNLINDNKTHNTKNVFQDMKILSAEKSDQINDLVKSIKEELDKKYKYEGSTKINQKYSVTSIKEKTTSKNTFNLDDIKPSAIINNVDNMTYGTLFHKLIQKLFCIKEYKEKLLNNQYILKTIEDLLKTEFNDKIKLELKQRLINDINNLLKNTEFTKYILNSINVYSELEFVLKSKLDTLEELTFEEETLIQGVIDMYIKTLDNKNIIIDFKTDFLTNEKELIDRYKYQLYIYKLAVEKIENVKVDNIYIYSTALNNLIKIN